MTDMASIREVYARIDGPDADPVYRALLRVWRRCIESPEFRWHMLDTESLQRVLLAWDRVRKDGDVTAEEILRAIHEAKLPQARCARDRDRATELEGELEDALDDAGSARKAADDECESCDELRTALEELLPCVSNAEVGTDAWCAAHEAQMALVRTA